jgi:hypothetical protein
MKTSNLRIDQHLGDLNLKVLRNILVGSILVVSCITLTLGVHTRKKRQEIARVARIASLKTEEAPTTKVLLLDFSIAQTPGEQPFTLTSIGSYNSHLDNVSSLQKSGYKLSLIKDGKSVYEYYFTPPETHAESIDPQTGSYVYLGSTKATSISVKTPYFPEGTLIQIQDSSGKVIFQDSIKAINIHDNKPSYNTTAGEDVEKIQH